MSKLDRGMDMARSSWAVLKQDKELMALPVVGGIVTMVAAFLLLAPFSLLADSASTSTRDGSDPSGGATILILLALIVVFFAVVLITQIFAGAVVHGAHTRMTGGDPSFSSSLKGALSATRQLIPWAIATGTVGVIVDQLRERGFLGQIVAGFINFAWKTATFIVLPILVIEKLGARDAYNRSRDLMGGLYGDSAMANFGLGLAGFVGSIVGILLLVAGSGIGGAIGGILVVAGFVWLIGVTVVLQTLTGVMRAAFYLYAVERQVPEHFNEAQFRTAFG
ncbi:MAG: hypothetical protein KDB86_04170 [Actinobacteria bacterium]|nr:hypothetical protein [Actinomycetota bacterium]MCB9388555.1 hypothetical protein [Acidimicrobiia bacterium]